QHLQRLRSQQPHVVLPSLEVFRRLPVIQLLQGTSPDSVEYPAKARPQDVATTLQKETWIVARLNTELQQWRDKAKKDLGGILGFHNWIPPNPKTLHPVERLTTRFMCKDCSEVAVRYREDNCFDFLGACAHSCRGKKRGKRTDDFWSAQQFVKDDKATTALEDLFALCDADPSLPEAVQTVKDLGATIECTSCGPGIVLDWKSVPKIGHSHRHERMTMNLLPKDLDKDMPFPLQASIVRDVSGPEPRTLAVVIALVLFTQQHNHPPPHAPDKPKTHKRSKKHGDSNAKHIEKRFTFPGVTSHLKEK
ncbi:hypothetical protein H0H93_011470, partial [Arthromyces matolae]